MSTRRIVRYVDEDDMQPHYGVLDGAEVQEIAPHPFDEFTPTGETRDVGGLRLLAPVIPSKIVCVGHNYAEHVVEMGGTVPDEPTLFLKPSSAVIGPGEAIQYPTGMTNEVHYEAEVAVVVRTMLRRAPAEECAEALLGVTAANDVTARDLQRSDRQWTRAKGFDTFCPLGPAIAAGLDLEDVGVRAYVDDELRQESSTADMIWSIPALLSAISEVMTLLPTDVVLTGTPPGVGPVTPGQTVRVEVDGVGALTTPVAERSAAPTGATTSPPD